jgi:hypothetical protein
MATSSIFPFIQVFSPPTQAQLDSYPYVFFTSDVQRNLQSNVYEYTLHDMGLPDNQLQLN